MIIEPLFAPLPPRPVINAHHVMLSRPELDANDYLAYVDVPSGRTLTRAEFKRRIFDLATAFTASVADGGLGMRVGTGETVAIFSPNTIDYPVLVHACLLLTVPFALFSSFSTEYETVQVMRIYALESTSPDRLSVDDLERNVRQKDLKREVVRPAKTETLAYLVFSSGTSGPPKAVMISHGNIISSFLGAGVAAEEMMKSTPPEQLAAAWFIKSLCVLPFYHTFGLHIYILRNLALPQTVIILPKFDVRRTLECIPRFRVTNIALVPSMVHSLLNSPDWAKTDLSSLKIIGTGAAYLPPKLAERLAKELKLAGAVPEGYGLSEITVSAIGKPTFPLFNGKGPVDPKATGLLLPGLEARLVRRDGTDAPRGTPGELWLRGDTVALGYYGDAAATAATFVDGWLRTGDMFRIDERGLFFYEDRAKDTLKVGGAQISPAEIEDCIGAMDGGLLADVCVAGVRPPRTRLGNDELWPRAWVVLSDAGRALGEKEVARRIEDWVKKNLSKYKALRAGVAFVDEIPKSPTGKVLRRVLQERYNAEQEEKKEKAGLKAKL